MTGGMARLAAGLILLAHAALPLAAQELDVTAIWARETPPNALSAAVYLTIRNPGSAADRLIAAASERAGIVQIHETRKEDNVFRMSAVESIAVAPGAEVSLAPGGQHIMLIRLTAPLQQGERFPLTLTFEQSGSMQVEVQVTSVAGPGQ